MIAITYECPGEDCDEVELDADYEIPEPDIGIQGGIIPPDAPTECSACGMVYTEQQRKDITKILKSRAMNHEGYDRE